jgi:hypothetical protein
VRTDPDVVTPEIRLSALLAATPPEPPVE